MPLQRVRILNPSLFPEGLQHTTSRTHLVHQLSQSVPSKQYCLDTILRKGHCYPEAWNSHCRTPETKPNRLSIWANTRQCLEYVIRKHHTPEKRCHNTKFIKQKFWFLIMDVLYDEQYQSRSIWMVLLKSMKWQYCFTVDVIYTIFFVILNPYNQFSWF